MNLDALVVEGVKRQMKEEAKLEVKRILNFNYDTHKVLTGIDVRHTGRVLDYHKAFLDEGIKLEGNYSLSYLKLVSYEDEYFWGWLKPRNKSFIKIEKRNVHVPTDVQEILREHREAKAWAKENGVILV